MTMLAVAETEPRVIRLVSLAGGGGGQTMAETTNTIRDLLPSDYEIDHTIVSPTGDDGGSTGEFRRAANRFGVPIVAVGDMRRAMGPLCPPRIRDLLETRLDDSSTPLQVTNMLSSGLGLSDIQTAAAHELATSLIANRRMEGLPHNLKGHTVGNFALAAFALLGGDIQAASDEAGRRFIRDSSNRRVVPVTTEPYWIQLTESNGNVVVGEHLIDGHPIVDPLHAKVETTAPVQINPIAEHRIMSADAVFEGPGSVFTSILQILAVNGVREAINNTRGQLAVVSNLAHEKHDPHLWTVAEHLQAVSSGITRGIDSLIFDESDPGSLPAGVRPLIRSPHDKLRHIGEMRLIGVNLARTARPPKEHDLLASSRSEVEHDHEELAYAIIEMLGLSIDENSASHIGQQELAPV